MHWLFLKRDSTQICRMLEDPVYIGRYISNRFDKEALEEQMEESSGTGTVEPIIDEASFEAAAILRTSRLPIKKAGRRWDGPLALTGLVKCSYCGANLVASTANGGKQTYYCCKTYLKQTKAACPGHRFRAETFEQAIFDKVLNWAFGLENIKAVVKSVKKAKAEREKPAMAIKARIKELAQILERYYAAFESGAVDNQELSERTGPHKLEKRRLEAELEERTLMERLPAGLTNPAKVEAIRQELRTLFNTATPQAKKRLLSLILEKIVVDGKKVTICAKPAGIIAVFDAGNLTGDNGVTTVINSSKEWQPVGIHEYNSTLVFILNDNLFPDNILRFHHVQIAEWIEQLLPKNAPSRETAVVTLAGGLGISRTRAFQFLTLLRIPANLRRHIIGRMDLTENRLRPIVQMDAASMKVAVGQLLGTGLMAKVWR